MKTFLRAQWQNLVMANYEIDPQYLLPFLPKGVELDYFNGKSYISLVGFLFKNTSIFGLPIPLMGTFEEVNLRFYVTRKVGNEVRRGVVFINETVPNQLVAWVANKLYKEHYIAIPTSHHFNIGSNSKVLIYSWKVQSKWNTIKVNAKNDKQKLQEASMEHFIFEHYYGYTKVDTSETVEYRINHPSWETNTVTNYEIDCDFEAFYGENFVSLNTKVPHSVILAEGSPISVDWKRVSF
jgi:uncharacterized protein